MQTRFQPYNRQILKRKSKQQQNYNTDESLFVRLITKTHRGQFWKKNYSWENSIKTVQTKIIAAISQDVGLEYYLLTNQNLNGKNNECAQRDD